MPAPLRRTEDIARLQTERLELRPLTLDDAADYWPLVSDPEVLRYVGETPCESLDAVRDLLRRKPLADYANYGFGRLAVVTRGDDRLVGWCGLKYLPAIDEVDIGYRFLRDCWGEGFATEAGAAVLRYGFDTLSLGRIIGLVDPGNTASARVMEKLGMSFERTMQWPAHPGDVHCYAIERTPA
jgi:[ribosomal protein S5]-alanine N-acetyltransferase